MEPAPADPLERLERQQAAARARAALDRLTERDREALLLREAGHSYRELAERLGLTIGAVGTTLARARKRLVEAFEAEEDHAARG
jgi:RNA polymerase sigma factor (sigma-70 family)